MKDVTRREQREPEEPLEVKRAAGKEEAGSPLRNQHQRGRRLMLFNKLIDACKRKDLNSIRALVSERPEVVNLRDKYNRSLLHYAVILILNDDQDNDETTNQSNVGEFGENNLHCFNYIANLCDEKLFLKQDLDGLSILHLAVISSNLPLVRHILFREPTKFKPLVSLLDNERHSPLHWAVITNQLQCVSWLIETGGVQLAHEPDLNHSTPLHYATQTRDYPKYRRQLKRMLSSVVSSKSCSIGSFSRGDQLEDEREERKQSAGSKRTVEEAAGLEILEFLVKLEGINLECVDKDRRTPLLWAASSGNREAILVLMQHGANLFSSDANRLTALHCAASHGFTDCLECLLTSGGSTSALPEVPNSQRRSSSGSARSQLNLADNLSCTPLFYAILSGNIDCLELLLDRGAEKDWQDVKGRTAAHFAALKGQLNSLKLLHERNANLWLPNKQGDLPLHYAVKSGRKQVVSWLLEHSPYDNSVNAINNFGRAPLHIAILKDNTQMTEYLIERGANLNQLVKIRSSSKKTHPQSETDIEELKLVNGSASHLTKQGHRYHYETALDMARNLNRKACLELLVAREAKLAVDVIAQRELKQDSGAMEAGEPKRANLKSLFDLQTIDGPSPIGFETSCSSNESPNLDKQLPLKRSSLKSAGAMPKLSGPNRVVTLPQTDSTNSSALSQNSETSLRGMGPSKPARGSVSKQQSVFSQPGEPEQEAPLPEAAAQNENNNRRDERDHAEEEDDDDSKRPYRGGISYNNQHMNASIKCKLYDCNHSSSSKSFPPIARQTSSGLAGKEVRSFCSQPNNLAGQEIITNVNVYTTSPHCLRCADDANRKCPNQLQRLEQSRNNQTNGEDRYSSDDTSEAASEQNQFVEGCYDCDQTNAEQSFERAATAVGNSRSRHELPGLCQTGSEQAPRRLAQSGERNSSGNPLHSLPRHLPPSQSYEQNLPVIMSDREERSNSAGTTSNERSPDQLGRQFNRKQLEDFNEETTSKECEQQASRSASGGARSRQDEEPRFDKFELRSAGGNRRANSDKYRNHVKSPVGEYIRSTPYTELVFDQQQPAAAAAHRQAAGSGARGQQQGADFSQVKPKVDTRRGQITSPAAGYLASDSGSTAAGEQARSVSRQTVIKTRRLSVDSVELASSVERSIRKYKQETKLFEELQNLKRSQIRSGKANEALLVKRLVDHFHTNSQAIADFVLVGLETYTGPYTYKAYERYLYDQLRKLSESNRAKLGRQLRQQFNEFESEQQQQLRDYLQEDMNAELELRRVVEGVGGGGSLGESDFDQGSVILEPSGALEEIRVRRKKDELGERELIEHEIASEPEAELAFGKNEDAIKLKQAEVRNNLETGASTEPEGSPEAAGRSVSGSSSRRSSLEAELDRLKSVPLKLEEGGETSEKIANFEADILSSSIITDCLGNISRCNSPPLAPDQTTTTTEEPEEAAKQEEDEAGKEVAADEIACEDLVSLPPTPNGGRRRSVINIGNKMDVVYHDISIEINHAPPAEPDSDTDHAPEPDGGATGKEESSIDANSEAAVESSARKLEKVSETDEEKEDTDSVVDLTASGGQIVGASEEPLDRAAKLEMGSSLSDASERLTSKRRASSPPGTNSIREIPKSVGGPEGGRKVGSVDYGRIGGESSQIYNENGCRKKVFNGYDLDEMKEHFRRLRQSKRRNSSDTKPADLPKSSYSSFATKRKLRSSLPKEKYKVNVNLVEVKNRWNYIRRRERARKRADSAERTRPSEPIRISKSQTNLRKHEEEVAGLIDGAHDNSNKLLENATSAYTLLYEINLKARDERQATGAGRGREAKPGRWCHKRIVKIVDVRTLKRTISLPESLIYSNNLLKRFNILKL